MKMKEITYFTITDDWSPLNNAEPKNGLLWTPKILEKSEIILKDFRKYINISETK
jgi:hypothetical protein